MYCGANPHSSEVPKKSKHASTLHSNPSYVSDEIQILDETEEEIHYSIRYKIQQPPKWGGVTLFTFHYPLFTPSLTDRCSQF